MSAIADETDAGPDAYGDELPKGTELLRGQYRIARFLNSGGFGITYLARDSLDRIVVIKECFPSTMCCRQGQDVRVRSQSHEKEYNAIVKLFGQEARALAKLDHPNIVGVHQVFEDNNTAYMALDFVRGRDLLDILEEERERLTPDVLRDILIRVLEAVEYIHDRGILHRDISPDNILLDQSGEPILIDFGAAREEATRKSRVLSHQHTVKDGYSPQEFYVSGSAQTLSSDLYALGATFYHLITGEAPPVSQARLAAVAANQADPFVPLTSRMKELDEQGFDRFFLAAIDKALEVFPDDRVQSAREWLTEIDTERRRAAAKERAQKDTQLQRVIRDLVTETNEFVEAARDKDSSAPKSKLRTPKMSFARRRAKPLFPDLMGPPPPEKDAKGRGAPPIFRSANEPKQTARPAPEPVKTGEDDDIVAKPQISPAALGDEQFLKDEMHRRRILDRVLNVSLWRFGQVEDAPQDPVGKVER